MRTIEENKKLCERYPYLIPRNLWTDKIRNDYDYSYIRGDGELPEGWKKLFMQMCEDIRQPLIDKNYLDKFRFSQIKEKFARMCCYNFGAPDTVHDIINKYEYMSQFVCEDCGSPATQITKVGYIECLCDDCAKKKFIPEYKNIIERISFKPVYSRTIYRNDEKEERFIDCSDKWKRLYE